MLAKSFVQADATSAVMISVKASLRTSRMTPLRICMRHKTTELLERFLDSHFLGCTTLLHHGFQLGLHSAVNRIPDGHDHTTITSQWTKQYCGYKYCHLLVLPNVLQYIRTNLE